MAYNFPTATQDFGYGIGETEEERRRREEQERMMREQQAAMQAQQQAEAEAQRQREQQEAEQRAAMEAQAQQSVAEIPSGMAAPNPYGSAIAQGQTTEGPPPTQGGPVAPDQANIEEQRRLQQAQAAQAQPVAEMPQPVTPEQPQPVAQPQPQAVQQPAVPVAPEQPQLPQPGPGVQVAGPTQMPPSAPAAPAAAPAMSMQERIAAAAQRAQERAGTAQPGQLPAASVGSLQQVAQQQVTPTFESRFTEAATDISKLDQLRKDETLTKEQRLLAGKQAQELLNRELGPIKAKEEVANMSEMEIARLLKSKSEEGSWGKLLLLGFVSPTLAAKEAAKLGLNDQWTASTTADGTPVLVKTRDGVPIEGVNGTTGKALSPKELVSAAASTTVLKGANVGGQTYRDPATGQTLTKVDTQRGPMYYDKAGNRVVPKGEPVPLTAGSDIATQLQLSQMKRQQAFVGQTAEERMRSFREVNNERTMANLPPLTPEQMGLNANGELIGQAQPGMPPTPMPPAAPGVMPSDRAAGDVAALKREIAATKPTETGRLQILNQELAKAQAQLGAGQPTAPVAPVAPAAAAPVTAPVAPTAPVAGQTPAQMQAARQAAAAGMKTEATGTAENLVANREALPKYESQAEQVLTTLNDALTHPGFSDVIGVPNILTGIWSPPSTDARNFKSKYDQLMGQQFLAAFQSLKGGGSITEVEGAKAEQAIAALRDPGISEVEFKRNAKILEDTVKAGVNRAREQVGMKPKYEIGAEAAPAKKANTPAKGTESTVGGVTYVFDGKGWKKK